MTNISEIPKTLCQESIECCYKAENACTYRINLEAILSVLQEKHHPGSSCIVDLIDMFQKPCLELDEEGRQNGITNIL